MSSRVFKLLALVGALLLAGSVSAEADPAADAIDAEQLRRCMAIEDRTERLGCFDAVTGGATTKLSFLEQHWDLAGESRLFQPKAHRPVYILPAHWTSGVNEAPFEEAAAASGADVDVQDVEVKFQISFKTKLLEHLFGGPAKLWFGYTQQSHFQLYNGSESRPFRETNYEPEIVAVFPTRRSWGKWTWRMVGIGAVHQSNGRSEPLSRSWNRIYGVVAGEQGNVSAQIRGWVRTDGDDADDDNPDIEEFIGRAEVVVNWSPGDQVFLVRARSNADAGHHRGSLQAEWFFPIRNRVRGQLQVFSGYGESLIDFDHRQTAVGLGVLLFDPF
jgi:phospholipase A1